MGVMSCSRKRCNNIMCDTYISEVGYICSECKEEFKNYLSNNGLSPKNSYDATKHLNDFMQTYKGEFNANEEFDLNEFLNQ